MDLLVKLLAFWLVSQLFFYKFLTQRLGGAFIFKINPDRLLFILIVITFITLVLRKRIKLIPIGKIEVIMIIFTLICTISYIFSGADTKEVVSTAGYRWFNTLFNINYYPFITYFIVKHITYKEEYVKTILVTCCIIGFYLTVTGIFEHYRLDNLVWPAYIMDPSVGEQWGRTRGPFVESATMGRVLTITLLCTMMVALLSTGLKRLFLFLLIILNIFALYFTYTRGPWLGFTVSLIILILLRSTMRKIIPLIVVLIFLGFISGSASKFSFFEDTLFSKRQNTVDYRMDNFSIALNMAKQNPLFGVGYGRFNSEWENYVTHNKYISPKDFDGNHNTFLGLLAEIGLVGFIFYLTIFYYLSRMCVAIYMKLDKTNVIDKSFVVLVLAMVASYFVTAQFVDIRFQQFQSTIMFLFFGIAASLYSKTVQSGSSVYIYHTHRKTTIPNVLNTR